MSSPLIHRLSNGIRVVLEPMPMARSVAVQLIFPPGSAGERDPQAGLAHFCEHLLFKGTRHRTWEDLAKKFNEHGGHMNAHTSLSNVCLSNRVVRADLEEALDYMAEMAFESTFPPQEVERERKVIIEEIAEYDDIPDDVCFEAFTKALFGSHPYGRPVIGTRETVSSFSQEESLTFWNSIANAGDMVLSMAGAVEPERDLAMVEQRIGSLAVSPRQPAPSAAPVDPPAVHIVERDFEQAQFNAGIRRPPVAQRGRFRHVILDMILGGGMGSRLFTEVREKRGLVYTIGSSTSHHTAASYFYFGGSTAPETLEEVLRVCRGELQKLSDEGVTEEELRIAKRQVERSVQFSGENSGWRASLNGMREMHGEEHLTDEEVIAGYNAVTQEQVQSAAGELWQHGGIALAVAGPVKESDAARLEGLLRD